MEKYDVIIIGKGPAGLSAALYTARGNLKTLVIGGGASALARAGRIENYFGFDAPVSGELLLRSGVAQAQGLGVRILDDEVTAVEAGEGYAVKTENGAYEAPAVLIATGQVPRRPAVPGAAEFEGRGVSYCTTCDGFFFKNKRVGVLGSGNYAVQEAVELRHFTGDVTIFTEGNETAFTGEYLKQAESFAIDARRVLSLSGDDALRRIDLEGGFAPLDGLFVASGSASGADFATRLGLEMNGNSIVVDAAQQTNLPGVFAAGDCTGGLRQISTAVGQGAVAGKKIIAFVRSSLLEAS